MKKRLLSALLALCMVLTMVPMAFATEADSSGNSDVSAQAATELPEAVDGVITLKQDVTLANTYIVKENTTVTIDLNGHTLSPAAVYSDRCLIKVSEGGDLTLIDSRSKGKITTNDAEKIRGISNNGTFTMNSGTIEVYSYAIENVVTQKSYEENQPVICNITGGELSASYAWTVLFMGAGVAGQSSGDNKSINTGENGSVRNDLMQVNISGNAKITGDQALTTNASNGIYAGFTLNISGSAEISGGNNNDNCAIYLPAVGVTNISGGTISGNQGIRIAAGELNITGGTIEGTKESNQEDLIAGGSGGTMGAIVVGKAGSGYVGDVLVNVDEGATVKNTAKDEGDKAAIVVSDKFMNDTSNGYNNLSITVNVNGATVEGNVVKVSNLRPGGSSDGGNTSLVLNNADITGNIINQTTAGDLSIVGGTITGNVENKSLGDLVIRDSATINGSVSNTGTDKDKGSVAIIGSTVTHAIGDASNNKITIIKSTIGDTQITTENVVALIGAKPYDSLEYAISEAQAGDTIELLKDIDNVTGGAGNTQGRFKIDKDLTLNGSGHMIQAGEGFKEGTSIFNIESGADVSITNLHIDSNDLAKHGLNIYYAGEVTLNNVEIINGTATAITNNGSKVTATGLKTSDNAWGAVNVDNGGTFTLVSGTLNEPSQIWSEDADDNEGSKITVPGGWTEVTVNKLDGKKEDVKTHYTTDIKKLGEAYNEDTKTVYDTVGRALSAAKNGETVQVINTSEVTGETVPEGVTLQVNSGVTLSGSLTNSGTIDNKGTINGDVSGNGEMTSEIRFSVSPNDAEVTVYDSNGDEVTGSGNTYQLENGNYRYTVSADGYYSESDNFTVDDKADTISVTLEERSSSSSGGSSGSSSSSSNRYTVSVDSDIDNGSISVSPSRAERGDTVTITIDPEEGYELDSLTVRDSRGNRIDVERQSDTRYTFEMPSGRVTVDASFTEVAETPETPDQIGSFTDVDTDDWFADAVQYMLDNGMMNGVTDTTFGPGTTTTRGMIVTILYRLEGEPDTTASSFTDAASGMYYADAVAWAQANSIVTGITETIFAPDQAITREQMAAILYRYAQYKGYDVTASNDLSSYTDASRISAYATAAMQWANAEGLITGNTSTTINPTGNATRAEVATILMRFCETVTK
nr:S-layer homology domain-containing protein [uncultured Agathobaculum sp.]